MDLDGLVELALRPALQDPNRLGGAVHLLAIDLGAFLAVDLSVLGHGRTFDASCSRPVIADGRTGKARPS
jgi:hypothetical protein